MKKKTKTSTKIAQTAAGVAITAGVIAAGATLSNPDNRRKAKELAEKSSKQIKKIANEIETGNNQVHTSTIKATSKKLM